MLEEVMRTMRQIHDRDVSPYDDAFLNKTIEKRMAANALDASADYAALLASSSEEAEAFSGLLNIGFSEFFRNPLSFSLLEQWILPTVLAENEKNGRAEIRIWSAGCAAGQEIYSVAILLDELMARADRQTGMRLFATDHSDKELALARRGLYDEAAVGNVRLKHLRKYFTDDGETYRIDDRIKCQVDFSILDLLDDRAGSPAASIYGDFDLVFCSNLLFYYRPEIRQQILHKVYRSLSSNGFLVTGEAERDIVSKQEGFRAVSPPSTIFKKPC